MLRGQAFGSALSELLDATIAETVPGAVPSGRVAILAMGSYGRRELCPGSDVDVLLLHTARADVQAIANTVWYPLWDAGFVLGHATRTVKGALALADRDLHALTALLDGRVVAGDATLAHDLLDRAHALACRRRSRLLADLARGAAERREQIGAIAEMLEPHLKEGAGGLRDLQSLMWAGATLDERGGLAALAARGYLRPDDPARLDAARALLLDVRVALHRATGSRSDVLTLQEQDSVAAALDASDADAMVRDLARTASGVAWIASDVWDRLRSSERGPAGRVARRDRPVAEGVVVRDGRIAFAPEATVDAGLVLRAAAAAAGLGLPFDRASLERCGEVRLIRWDAPERDSFVALLRAGPASVPVFEALDHVGALARIVPEWEHVRFLPQRNAYHRFTVGRHLLEAVAECASLLVAEGFDGDVARRARADVLLLAALLHDIAKGRNGDHSVVGAETAVAVARRIGLDEEGVALLEWLVRRHLILAETATRRDLSDERTITRFGRTVGRSERLDLLYALTVGDSRATSSAAWGPTKAALVRELYLKTDGLLERGVVAPILDAERTATLDRYRELVAARRLAIEWSRRDDGLLECAVAAPDRTGLLGVVAGALALAGFDIRDAIGYSYPDGMALEVFHGHDRFGRLAEGDGRDWIDRTVRSALEGGRLLDAELRDRIRRYRKRPGDVRVLFDLEASEAATVVEVHAGDEVGLLAKLAATFADLDVDVTVAKVATLGDRVVDVFYVRDALGHKISDRLTLDQLKATLVARLTTDYALP